MNTLVSQHERGRLRIAHLKLADAQNLLPTLERATLVSGATLNVARVGIWFLSEDRSELTRVVASENGSAVDGGDAEMTVSLRTWPAYCAAIESRRVVAADDARSHPQTSELKDTYLDKYGITSLLDAPIFIGGEVWGIVCHEHVGPMRRWSPRERDFSISVADMVSALLERSHRLEMEIELRAHDAIAAEGRRRDALIGMAAGVAHDFNTVLQSIVLNARAATGEPDDTKRRTLLDQVVGECERGSRFVRQLSDYAHSRASMKVPLDMARILHELKPTLETLVGPERRLSVVAPEGPLFVVADRPAIERMVLNLVTNAREATPAGGEVAVRVVQGPHGVRLQVRDDGPGVDPAKVGRIFNPFFSTKPNGESSGLGLAIVLAIVDDLGGYIEVGAAGTRGALFEIVLPLAPTEA